MLLQIHKLRVGLAADGTTVWLDTVVDHLVLLQVGPLHKSLIAAVALVRFETTVQELMLEHISVLREVLVAHWALEGLEAIVNKMMALQVCQLREPLIADLTHVRTLATVRFDVLPEAALGGKGFPADVAGELVIVLHIPMHLHLFDGIEAL